MKKSIKFVFYLIIQFLSKKLGKYHKNLPYFVLALVCLLVVSFGIYLFVELTQNLHTEYLKTFDDSVSNYVQSFRSENPTTFFTIITDIGDVWGYFAATIICSGILYYFLKNWKYATQLIFILVLAVGSNVLLKQIINRQRPLVEHLVTVKTLSYPSGHAMTAMAFYGFLIYLVLSFKIQKLFKYSLVLLLSFLILSIGISRIYLGVHYPSDIVGGFIAGFIWVIFSIFMTTIFKAFNRSLSFRNIF